MTSSDPRLRRTDGGCIKRTVALQNPKQFSALTVSFISLFIFECALVREIDSSRGSTAEFAVGYILVSRRAATLHSRTPHRRHLSLLVATFSLLALRVLLAVPRYLALFLRCIVESRVQIFILFFLTLKIRRRVATRTVRATGFRGLRAKAIGESIKKEKITRTLCVKGRITSGILVFAFHLDESRFSDSVNFLSLGLVRSTDTRSRRGKRSSN